MKRVLLTCISIMLFFSCDVNYDFRSIEEFDLVDNGIEDNEQVKVLYYCGGPHDDEVEVRGFYRHAVVSPVANNDTFNILTFPNHDLDNLTSSNNVLIYGSQPDVKREFGDLDKFPEEMKKKLEKLDTLELSWSEYRVVVRDPEFDYIAKNDFKTVIGSLTKK